MVAILLRKPLVAGVRRSPGNFLRLLHHEPISKPSPTSTSSPESGLAASFFETSCGLSPSAALAAAAKINMKTTANAESVLRLLGSYGFNESNVALIATKLPLLFIYHPEKCIKPKLDLFVATGFTGNFISKLFSKDPNLLMNSLERKLSPNLHLLMAIHGGDRKAIATTITGSTWILRINHKKYMLPNMETLRKHGVTDADIPKFIRWYPRAIVQEPNLFSKSMALLKDIGLDPSKKMYVHVIGAMAKHNQSTWERKLQLYRSLGWSQEETLFAFKKNPACINISEEKLRKVMTFFVENLKWEPSRLALRPFTLSYSFEKRIVPRYVVFNILSTSGDSGMKLSFSTLLEMSESNFLKKYVCKYSDTLPELLEAYKAKLDMTVTVPSNFVL